MTDSDLRWQILSYPRSGNHAVRTIIERVSGRPTLGCPGTRHDPPIHLRDPNRKAGLIRITDNRPIGYKAHSLRELVLNQKAAGMPLGLIFILREPVAAISSQSYRIVSSTYFNRGKRLRRSVPLEVDKYLSLIHYYRAERNGPRILVRFEDIVSRDAEIRLAAVTNLLAAMGLSDRRLDVDTLDRTLDLAKDSQQSLGRIQTKMMEEIKRSVSSLTTAADIEMLLK